MTLVNTDPAIAFTKNQIILASVDDKCRAVLLLLLFSLAFDLKSYKVSCVASFIEKCPSNVLAPQ